MPKQSETPAFFVMCTAPGCAWKRSYKGNEPSIPNIPHAMHYLQTGHDQIRTGVGEYGLPPFSDMEWLFAKVFSAGWRYGCHHSARAIASQLQKSMPRPSDPEALKIDMRKIFDTINPNKEKAK